MENFPLCRLLLGAARESSEAVCAGLRARGHGARLSHAALVTNLDEGGTRLTVLAERAGMTKQGMSALAKELEGAGYIERASDPSDARASLIVPTARGHELIADMLEEMGRIEDEMRARLGEAELAAMRRGLEELMRAKPVADET